MITKNIFVNVHKPKSDDRRTKLTIKLIKAYRAKHGQKLYFYKDGDDIILATTPPPQGKDLLFSVEVDGEGRARIAEPGLKQISATFGDRLKFAFIGKGKAIIKVLRKKSKNKERTILPLPEEVENSQTYIEGATKQITINAFERNPKARRACIDYYGLNCRVCDFKFGEIYGDIGRDFIHVHHLTPISSVGEKYKLDPIRDLRPVCPNCHAMLHSKRPTPYTIEEMQSILKKTGAN
jgi:hypothetical protein